MTIKSALVTALACVFGGSVVIPTSRVKIHEWVLEMHQAQMELLKIDWGQPGFCTEWDRDYSVVTRSCGKRGKIIERGLVK